MKNKGKIQRNITGTLFLANTPPPPILLFRELAESG
jgi:hypothetical protein